MTEEQRKRGVLSGCYWGLVQGENFLGHFLLLVIRLYWGWLLVMTGFGKWVHADGVANYFASLGLPNPQFLAYFVGSFELIGGVSLILGLWARIFSIPLVVILITAYVTAHPEALAAIFTNPKLFIAQEPFLFLYAALVVLCFGSGFLSFDYWLEKRTFRRPL